MRPPGDVGATNKPLYEKLGKKALWQGGEDHEVAGFSFNSSCNYKDAIGRQFVRVVSCNTTGLCRIINEIDKEFGVTHVHAIMVRRGLTRVRSRKDPSMPSFWTRSAYRATTVPTSSLSCPTSP